MKTFSSPDFKVGLFFLAVVIIIAVMSIRVSEDPSYMGPSKTVTFFLDDASGLVVNSAVKTAGISIGVIRSIQLHKGLARVSIVLPANVPLYKSARIEIRASGILGDRHVELLPGDPDDGLLADGDQILEVDDKGSLDALVNEVGKITSAVNNVAVTLQKSIQGEGDRSSSLGRIVNNIENVTADLSEITGSNKGDLRKIVSRLDSISETIDQFVSSESDDGFKASFRRASSSLSRIDTTLQNLEEISGKVNRGEGTIGRLINDESTIDEINTAVEGVSMIVGQAVQVQTTVDFHSGWLSGLQSGRSVLGIKLQPGLDRYYEIAVVDDRLGSFDRTRTQQTVDGTGPVVTETTRNNLNDIRFTALFAKNIYRVTLKGGLIESSGGIGLDYRFFKDKLLLSAQLFKFSDPNISAYMRYNLAKSFYLIGGVYDAANNSGYYSSFLGAGITLTNDDFNLLVGALSF